MKIQLKHLETLKDLSLHWIEKTSGQINNWAWNKRWKNRDPDEWIREYREWKKSTEKRHN